MGAAPRAIPRGPPASPRAALDRSPSSVHRSVVPSLLPLLGRASSASSRRPTSAPGPPSARSSHGHRLAALTDWDVLEGGAGATYLRHRQRLAPRGRRGAAAA